MTAPSDTTVARRREAKQRRSKVKVEHILATALEMLSQGPADKVSTNAIAKQAGVSIGTLYQFFPNKEAIFYELFKRWLGQTLDALDAANLSLKDGSPKEECVDAILHALAGHEDINARGHWQLRRAMGSSEQLAQLEAQHLEQIVQRILAMQAKFGRTAPTEVRGELALLQNQVTIACLQVIALSRESEHSDKVWAWARKILMLALDYEELLD